MMARTLPGLLLALALALLAPTAAAFDHAHATWDGLLRKHVVPISGGNAAQLGYAGMKSDRARLKAYLDSLTGVGEREYAGWSKAQQLAFLINAYNAFTVELILGRYPDLESIKDLGSVFQSPWKKKFFTLLGRERTLDEVEHELIRAPGSFDDPRIHAAVVCASVGCPMLRNEAYVAEKLDAQLEDGLVRFLSDRSRNRFDAATGTLQVSKIFDWYRQDFAQGHHGFTSLKATFARYADRLADDAASRQRLRTGHFRIEYLDYDWKLNDRS